ncbi:hypothetical protein QEN19_001903 [Hanseniaspora menglaensis]
MFKTPALSKDIDYDYVYDPSEDTFLLMDCLEKDFKEHIIQNHKKKGNQSTVSLEIGSGSGMISSFIHKNCIFGKNNIHLSSDINHLALAETVKTVRLNTTDSKELLKYDCLLTNLFDGIRDKMVDYFVFNPPYVPSEVVPEKDDLLNLALEGGLDGMEVTNALLEKMISKLNDNGIGYILFCARNKPNEVMQKFNKKSKATKFVMELVEKRKCGWEVLSVYRFIKRE